MDGAGKQVLAMQVRVLPFTGGARGEEGRRCRNSPLGEREHVVWSDNCGMDKDANVDKQVSAGNKGGPLGVCESNGGNCMDCCLVAGPCEEGGGGSRVRVDGGTSGPVQGTVPCGSAW